MKFTSYYTKSVEKLFLFMTIYSSTAQNVTQYYR